MARPLNCWTAIIITVTAVILTWPASVHAQGGGSAVAGQHKWDCRRLGVSCFGENSTCDVTKGACTCAEGLTGYDCSYMASKVSPCSASTVCLNGGECTKNDKDEDECHCPVAWLPPDCSMSRVSHKCSHDSIIMTVVPAMGAGAVASGGKGFQGAVFVDEHEESEKCKFVKNAEKYVQTVPFDECKGKTNINTVDANGRQERGFSILVTFLTGLLTSYDEHYRLTCTFPKSGQDVLDSVVIASTNAGKKPIEGGSVPKDVVPLIIQVMDSANKAVDASKSLVLGEEVDLRFILNGGEVYKDFRVESITATNGKKGKAAKSMQMVTKGCALKDMGALLREFTEKPGPPMEKNLKFNLFQFQNSHKLEFMHSVRFCDVNNTGLCNNTVCDPTIHETRLAALQQGIGRRKRAVDEEWEVLDYLTTLYVRTPFREEQQQRSTQEGRDDADQDDVTDELGRCGCSMTVLLASVTALAALVIVCGSCCFYLMVRGRADPGDPLK